MQSIPRTLGARRLLKPLAAALLLAACGGGTATTSSTSTSTGAGGRACIPGAQVSCACPGGQQGVQTCNPDGSALEACEGCAPADAGAICAKSAQKLYYHDVDQDSYGGTETQMACEPPGSNWVLQGGDCDDANPLVHPGQATYFSQPYTVGGVESFDYNCDGQETPEPTSTPLVGADAGCTGQYTAGGCIGGDGWQPTMRTGVGVNPYCGSVDEDCSAVNEQNIGLGVVCEFVPRMGTEPLGCN